ncbi:MAG TPA: twin-arginine translocase TatA/TatE family subunit [Pyrinomonadaceae bacterium]|nr:twin-arginine translocase TatA/TatE family subunit [Pyrinomonadaceae bacterium]
MNFGGWEIFLVVVVLFLLFGASRLPQLAKSLGQSRKAFKEGMREAEEDDLAAQQLRQSTTDRPIAALTDAELKAEMERREEARMEH